jgi:arylsulfatase A-like enzyme
VRSHTALGTEKGEGTPGVARGLLRAAGGGAAFGVSLAAAEAVVRLAAGGGPRLSAWCFLGAVYAGLMGTAGVAAALLLRLLPARSRLRGLRPDLLLLGGVLLVEVALAVHDRLVGLGHVTLPFAAGVLLAALLIARLLWRLAGSGAAAPGAAVLAWPAVMITFLATVLLPRWPPWLTAAAFPGVCVPGCALAALLLRRGRGPWPLRVGLVATLPALGVLSLVHLLPRHDTVRDQPQPDPGPHAAWLRGKPNVVLIVLDTVRAANVSAYGYARATTPHLDAFAASSVLYPGAATAATWTQPGHASLFTGLYPWQHGVGFPLPGAPPALTTLADVLTGRGYATAAVVANPALGQPRVNQGFRHFDARSRRPFVPSAMPLLHRVLPHLSPRWRATDLMEWVPAAWRPADRITDDAIAWLGRRPPGQPFLLFVNYMDAHTPFVPRPGFVDRWPGRVPAWPQHGLTLSANTRRVPVLTGQERAHMAALYDAALSFLDVHLGRLLDFLRAQPGYEDTWVVVTSDHGEMLGEHDRLGHDCQLYDEILRVPLVVHAPRGAALPAADALRPLQTVDLTPLLLDALGLPPLPGTALPAARPEVLAAGRCACATLHAPRHAREVGVLVEGRLKYLEEDGRGRLFDLAGDAGEAHDLAGARAADAARLRARLQEMRAALPALPAGPVGPPVPENVEALRALGYQ